jgi:hypothetical protein
MFHSFLRTFLNIFQASFPVNYRKTYNEKNGWITQGIKIFKHERSLYSFTKNSNDPKAKTHYIKYCQILRKVIKEAKKLHYGRLTAKSNNTIKTTWKIIKKEIGKGHPIEQATSLLMNNEKLTDP